MPQLFFEPSVTKIDNDTYIVVPKNDNDTIDVSNNEGTTDIKSGSYQFIAKCSELVKDIIVAFYGNPVTENGVKKSRVRTRDVVDNLVKKYENTFLPEERTVNGETVNKYVIILDGDDTEMLFETPEEAIFAVVNWVKEKLRNPQPANGTEEEAEEGVEE